jgi:hypothetical protein
VRFTGGVLECTREQLDRGLWFGMGCGVVGNLRYRLLLRNRLSSLDIDLAPVWHRQAATTVKGSVRVQQGQDRLLYCS